MIDTSLPYQIVKSTIARRNLLNVPINIPYVVSLEGRQVRTKSAAIVGLSKGFRSFFGEIMANFYGKKITQRLREMAFSPILC